MRGSARKKGNLTVNRKKESRDIGAQIQEQGREKKTCCNLLTYSKLFTYVFFLP